MLPLYPQDCVQLNQYKLQSEIGKVGLGRQEQWSLLSWGFVEIASAWHGPFSSGDVEHSLEVRVLSLEISSMGWEITPLS